MAKFTFMSDEPDYYGEESNNSPLDHLIDAAGGKALPGKFGLAQAIINCWATPLPKDSSKLGKSLFYTKSTLNTLGIIRAYRHNEQRHKRGYNIKKDPVRKFLEERNLAIPKELDRLSNFIYVYSKQFSYRDLALDSKEIESEFIREFTLENGMKYYYVARAFFNYKGSTSGGESDSDRYFSGPYVNKDAQDKFLLCINQIIWEAEDNNDLQLSVNKEKYERSFALTNIGVPDDYVSEGADKLHMSVEHLSGRCEAFLKKGFVRKIMFHGPPGTGKAQPLSARILTPSGWTTMGELYVGKEILTPSGERAEVAGVFPQGEKDIYKLTFSDGTSTECCKEHLWLTKCKYERQSGKDYSVKSTDEISKRLIKWGAKNHSIPLVQSNLDFNDVNLEIDPYLLGILLGDGSLTGSSVRFTTIDEEILDSISVIARKYNAITNKHGSSITYSIATKRGQENPVLNSLRKYNLHGLTSDKKFIPQEYLFSKKEYRIALLQGLLDSDGTIDKRTGSVSYTTTSKLLASGVLELVNSLGGIAKLVVVNKKYEYANVKHVGKDAYLISISLPNEIIPFRLSRKLNLVKPKTKYLPARYIVSIEYVGKKEAQCIYVNHKDHLYITDDYIVTHNTCLARTLARKVSLGRTLRIEADAIEAAGTRAVMDFIVLLRPKVVLFDDLDRTRNTVVEILHYLEGLGNEESVYKDVWKKGLLIIGTVNSLSTIDPALLRPGRFDEVVLVDEPSEQHRRMIILHYINKTGLSINKLMNVNSDLNLKNNEAVIDWINNEMKGFAPADIREVIQASATVGEEFIVGEINRVKIQRTLYEGESCDAFLRGKESLKGLPSLKALVPR